MPHNPEHILPTPTMAERIRQFVADNKKKAVETEDIKRRNEALRRQAAGGSEEVGDLPIPEFDPATAGAQGGFMSSLQEVLGRAGEEVRDVAGIIPPIPFFPGSGRDLPIVGEPIQRGISGAGRAFEATAESAVDLITDRRTGQLIPRSPYPDPKRFFIGNIPELSEEFRQRPALEQVGLGLLFDPLNIVPGAGAISKVNRLRRGIQATRAGRAPLALGPGTGRTTTGAVAGTGEVAPVTREVAPVARAAAQPAARPSLTVVTSTNPSGTKLLFDNVRSLRRAAAELSQRGDVETLRGTATAAEVDIAAARLRQAQPTGTQTTIPVTRAQPSRGPTRSGGEIPGTWEPRYTRRQVTPRPTQRQLPRGLDPENLDELRRVLRSTEDQIARITRTSKKRRPQPQTLESKVKQLSRVEGRIQGLRPRKLRKRGGQLRGQAELQRQQRLQNQADILRNEIDEIRRTGVVSETVSPTNQRLRALESKATNLRGAIDDLRTPTDIGLEIPGVVGREAVQRVFPPDPRRALGPGVRPSLRPATVAGAPRQRTTGVSRQVRHAPGRQIEARNPAEAVILRQEARRNTASAEEITTKVTKNEPAEKRVASTQSPDDDPVIQKVVAAIRGAKRLGPESRSVISRTRTARFAAGMQAAERAPLLSRSQAFFRRQAGDIPRPDISPLQVDFAPGEWEGLIDRIHNSGRLRAGTFDPFVADEAFKKLFSPIGGTLPEPRELELLERVFGSEFVKAILSQRSLGDKAWDNFLSLWNLPRALMATGDLSATLRQAAPLAPDNKRAYIRAFREQVKAFFSEASAKEVNDVIESHPNFSKYTRRPGVKDPRKSIRLDLTSFSTGTSFAQREEVFMSKWAGNIPLVRNAERAYVTMLNKLRFDVMDDMVRQAESGLGRALNEEELDHIASFINWATGRGPLGKAEAFAPLLNGMFFAPRFATSRFALPIRGLTSAVGSIPGMPLVNPALAETNRRMARSLGLYVATGISILKLAELGGAEVSANPTSSDFGKIRLGKTRIDIWAGHQQVSRLVAQIITGYGTSPTTGERYPLVPKFVPGGKGFRGVQLPTVIEKREIPSRGAALLHFVRGKLGPMSGEGLDQLTGKDFLGDEVGPVSFTELRDFRRNPLYANVAPMFVQDVIDAVLEEGLSSGLKAAPSFFGAGAVTYTSDLDRISYQKYNKRFIELSDAQKEFTRKQNRREKRDNR